MKLRTRIISGFVIVALIGWVIGVAGLVTIHMLGDLAEEQDSIRESYADAARVLGAHYEWRQSLTEAVYKGEKFTGSIDPTTCALGKWLNSDTSNTDDDIVLELFHQVSIPHSFIHETAASINSMIESGNKAEAISLFEGTLLPKTNETISLIGQIEGQYSGLLYESSASLQRIHNLMSVVILGLFAIALAASIFLALYITKTIMKPIRDMDVCARKLSKGHLHFECNYHVDDEIGRLASSFHDLIVSMSAQADVLRALAAGDYTATIERRSPEDVVNDAINTFSLQTSNTLSGVRGSSEQVSAGAHEMAQAAQALAVGSTAQASAIEQFSATLDNVLTETDANSNLAAQTLVDIQKTSSLMDESIGAMEQMVEAMKDIDKSSNEIRTVIKVINDIAFQTNILALNAAIEAARAGEHGKGFAVVADEVRNLASKSAEAAEETTGLIVKSIESVAVGNEYVEKVSRDLEAVGELSGRNAEAISKINEASARQNAAVSELNIGISQISSVTHSNSATSEQVAASAEEMSAQASYLREMIDIFRLKDDSQIYGDQDLYLASPQA